MPIAERTETAAPIELNVNRNGGVTGLTVVVAVRDALTANSWLDFNDLTFKTAAWTTRQAAVAEVSAGNAPGKYSLAGGLDISAITNLPAGTDQLALEFDVSGGLTANVADEIQLTNNFSNISDFDETTDPVELLDSGGTAGTSADELVTDIEVDLSAAHGAGQWDGTDSDWTAGEREQIRFRLAMDGTQTDPTTGIGTLEDILTDTDETQGKLPTNNIMGSSVKTDKDDEIDTILADTNDIQTRLPAALVGGRMDSDVGNLQAGTITVTEAPNLDVLVSSRSDFDETANPVELLDSGGLAGTSAAELVVDTEAALASAHGSGQWDGTDSDWTAGEREQIRFRLALDGTQTDPTTGLGTIEDILADTNEMQGKLPTNEIMGSSDKADHDGEIGDILADTANMQPKLGIPSVDVSADIAAIQSDTDNIQTRLPAALVGGRMDSDVGNLQAGTITVVEAPNLDVLVSSRSDFNETTDPVELLDSGGTAGTSAAELVLDVDTNLSAGHGAGQWDGTDSDWTVAERNQIRFRLALDGTQVDPTTGAGTIEDILADTDSLDTTKVTTARANNLDNLNDTITSRSSHSAADVDTVLTASHDAGSWASAASSSDWTSAEREQIRFRLAMDGVQDDPITSTGTIEDILADTNKLPANPADVTDVRTYESEPDIGV